MDDVHAEVGEAHRVSAAVAGTAASAVSSAASATAASAGVGSSAGSADGVGAAIAGADCVADPATHADDQSVETLWAQMSDEDKEHWSGVFSKHVRTYVRFLPDVHKTSNGLEAAIRGTPLANMASDLLGLVVFFYDVKKSGESGHRPDLRQPPLRDREYMRLVRAALTGRTPGEVTENTPQATLRPNEVALLLDGGRRGLASRLHAPWKEGTTKEGKPQLNEDDVDDPEDAPEEPEEEEKPGFVATEVQVAYTEASLAANRKRLRGTASIKQVETLHVLSCKRLQLPDRKRLHYDGTTAGNLLAGVSAPKIEDTWHVPWGEKKKMLGKAIIPVGGRTIGADAGEEGATRRTATTMVPMAYHTGPEELYEELCHDFHAKLIIDLTPLDERLAYVCLKRRHGYLGITFSEAHAQALEARLVHRMKLAMAEPGSCCFNPHYRKALGMPAEEANNANDDAQQPAKAKATVKPRRVAKGTTTSTRAKASTELAVDAKDCADGGGQSCKRRRRSATQEQDDAGELGDVDVRLGDTKDDDEIWDPLAGAEGEQ